MTTYTLPRAMLGYDAGTVLRDVPLREARSWECNRCGDCCSGMREGVRKDDATGMPLLTWGSRYPADLYAERYGAPLLQPIVLGDGGPAIGEAFEVMDDGREHTAFACSQLREYPEGPDGPETGCGLHRADPDPQALDQLAPRSCGEFPVFGLDVDATIIDGHPFVPPTGATPRCTWHGIRIVGPWRDTPAWQSHWADQQEGQGG